jgi:carboxyl-terminal processing protease
MSQTPQSWRKLSAPFALAALALLALSAAGSSGAPAATGLLPAGAVAPTPQQRMLAPRIASILEQNHYRHIPIDRQLSPLVYQHFLTTLDGQHSYFLASDIASFERWKYQFGDMIHTGQVDPAYLIFNVLQQRNRERIAYALKLLDTEPNWTTNETLLVDRTHATWPTTEAQMDELWRLRVKNDAISLMLAGKGETWQQAADTLRKRYQSVLRRIGEVSPEDVFEALMNSYCAAYDPHSNYFSPRSSEEYRIQMSGSYEGIGASLGQTDDYVTVTGVLPGGPAAADGTLKPNDRITAVGQGAGGSLVDIIGWRLDDVVQLIRGKEGTIVRLQILPAGSTPGTPERMLSLTRNKVTLQSQAPKQEVRQIMRDGRTYKIGVITIPIFYNDMEDTGGGNTSNHSTTNDVRRLLQQLTAGGGVDALVLDLRGDGGGYLPEAIGLTHLFVNHGPVVQLRDTTGQLEVLDQPDSGQVYSGPLAVLVDRTSASASEIFAGAIQDYHRGLIIGQTTFGKGTVQSVIPLNRWSSSPVQGQVTVTIGKFYRVTGESTQLRGVTPDIMLPSPISLGDFGESMMENALPWDRIAPVTFHALPPFGGLVQTLAAEQSARSMHNSDYQWLLASLSVLDEARQQKTLSLNLQLREQQRTMEDQTRLVEENLRRSSHGLPALKSVADIEATDEPDVVMAQAVDIMADDVAARAGLGPAPQLQQARVRTTPTAAVRPVH